VRFGTGDVSRWTAAADDELRLAGVLGRVGAAVKVRGMFVHPHQAAEVVGALRPVGVSGGRFVVTRSGDRDVLTLEVLVEPGADLAAVEERAVEGTRSALRVRPEVTFPDALDDGVLVDARSWD
jgi:phenylacetate-CoA ligase